MRVRLTIDGKAVEAEEGSTILRAAEGAGLYIPSLCAHPDLPPQKGVPPAEAIYHGARRIAHDAAATGLAGCGICAVNVEGEGYVPACASAVREGMAVATAGAEIEKLRRERLSKILARHPHACLTCAQRHGCTRELCSMNVPVAERCCPLFGNCEIQALADYVGIDPATPRYVPPEAARITGEPLFDRDPALCVACGRCVRACEGREVRALGWVRDGSGERWVGPLAPTPIEAGCRLCGSCVEVCPTGALLDRPLPKLAERLKALVPCRSACPAGTDVPRYLQFASEGRLAEAAAVVAERAPLVETLGHVCFHPCEDACRRNEVNGAPISICLVKREAGRASAAAWTARLPAPRPSTGRKVAIVGAGPAGLVAAQALRLLGHSVTIFEARDAIGGMLAQGIPAFRLPRDVVARETAALTEGVRVVTGRRIGNGGLTALREEHDAVIVASGAALSVRLDVAGADLEGIRPGLEFLGDLAAGRVEAGAFAGRRVAVVGGGNVAVDCARAALRLGAAAVEAVSLEQPHEMPAYRDELAEAAAEGVAFRHGFGIRCFEGDESLRRIVLKRCTRVFDAEGRFDPRYDETVTLEVPADVAILAIGQRPDRSILPASLDGIFLAGDLATGPRSVVEAIASGREAALAADRHLGGSGELSLSLGATERPAALGRVEGFATLRRLEPEPLAPERRLSLEGASPSLGPERAREEADRCLRCDLRLGYREPPRPPVREVRLDLKSANLERVPAAEGVVRIYDAEGEVLEIAGGPDMRQELAERVGAGRAATFDFEPCPMFTQRQNELLGRYMESHGRAPPGVREEDQIDDLY